MNHSANVKRFEDIAAQYDDFIRRVVPYYAEQNIFMMDLLPYDDDATLSVLDLGVGTGAIAHAMLERFPHAKVHGIDLGENMLAQSQERLAPYGDRYSCECADMLEYNIPADTYDLVIAGLSVHHLDDASKQRLTARVHSALRPDGMYMLREAILAATPALHERYRKLWCAHMRANGIDADEVIAGARQHDQPATIAVQLDWMRDAGFANVGCHWQYLQFAIFSGQK